LLQIAILKENGMNPCTKRRHNLRHLRVLIQLDDSTRTDIVYIPRFRQPLIVLAIAFTGCTRKLNNKIVGGKTRPVAPLLTNWLGAGQQKLLPRHWEQGGVLHRLRFDAQWGQRSISTARRRQLWQFGRRSMAAEFES